MARVRQRDAGALRELYDRHAGVIYGLGLRILRDASEAEDLVQDVFLHLWRRAEMFDPGRGQFGGWLLSLARNRAIDRLRSRQAQGRGADAYELERAGDTGPPAEDPNESAYASELRRAIAEALGALPEAQRQAVELAYFGGLSHSEIATRLEAPLGTVKARIRQGMIKLRDGLGRFAEASFAGGTAKDETA